MKNARQRSRLILAAAAFCFVMCVVLVWRRGCEDVSSSSALGGKNTWPHLFNAYQINHKTQEITPYIKADPYIMIPLRYHVATAREKVNTFHCPDIQDMQTVFAYLFLNKKKDVMMYPWVSTLLGLHHHNLRTGEFEMVVDFAGFVSIIEMEKDLFNDMGWTIRIISNFMQLYPKCGHALPAPVKNIPEAIDVYLYDGTGVRFHANYTIDASQLRPGKQIRWHDVNINLPAGSSAILDCLYPEDWRDQTEYKASKYKSMRIDGKGQCLDQEVKQ